MKGDFGFKKRLKRDQFWPKGLLRDLGLLKETWTATLKFPEYKSEMPQSCESDIIRSVLHFKTEDYWCTIKCKRIRAPLYVEHHWQLFFSSQRMVEMSSLVSCQIEWCSNWYLSLLLRCLTNQSARPGTRAWQKYLCFPDKVLKLHVSKVQWNWIALTSGIGILNIYLLGAPWVFPITFSLSFNISADSWSNLAIKDSFGISPEIF